MQFKTKFVDVSGSGPLGADPQIWLMWFKIEIISPYWLNICAFACGGNK